MPKIELRMTDADKARMQAAADASQLRLATWAKAQLMIAVLRTSGAAMTPQDAALLASLKGFTPGPWGAALEKGCHGVVASVLGEEFNMVALIGNDTDTPDREPMRFANAALIAAAPDLHRIATEQAAEIERLRDALERIECIEFGATPPSEEVILARRVARAALAVQP